MAQGIATSSADCPHFTELIFEDPDSGTLRSVKTSLSEKEGIPSLQRRLSFPPLSNTTSLDSFQSQIRRELDQWQAILFANDKAIGRLLKPAFSAQRQNSIHTFEFKFNHISKKQPSELCPLSIPLDESFASTDYSVQLFGRCGEAPIALPFRFRLSGRDTVAKVSLKKQQLQYIQKHKQLQQQSNSFPEDISIPCVLAPPENNAEDMEAVLPEAKPKDFSGCGKDNSLGKVNVNRGKKPKKKKPQKLIKNPNSNGNYDRFQSNYFTSVTSNRMRDSRESISEQKGFEVVDKILRSIKGATDHSADGSDRHSDDQEDAETSSEAREPISPLLTESENGGPVDLRKREQLTAAINDFEEEDVYIRRNRSVGSLARYVSAPPVTAAETTPTITSSPPSQSTDQPPQSKPPDKHRYRLINGQPSSPVLSPHRLNFRSANGLLQSNCESRGEESRQSGPGFEAADMDYPPQPLSLQALLQMGPSHHPVGHQLPIGLSPVGHPMQSLFGLGPQPVLQGHPAILGNVSNLHPGIHLGELFGQDAHRRGGITPEPTRREDYRKPREELCDDVACFYMKPTNDLDRFLTEVTPMLQLDPSMESQKALDQLSLVV